MTFSIDRIQFRLTMWYVIVFTVIMAMFGGAVYTVINRQMLLGLDRSLERAVNQRTRFFLARGRSPTVEAQDSVLWERKVIVFDDQAQPISPSFAEPWVQQVARQALRDSIAKVTYRTQDRGTWLLYGKRFLTNRNNTYVTVAVTDVVDARLRYPSIFTGFVSSAIIAILLVGISGAALARKSTRPIQASFDQMRRFMSDAAHELKTPVAVLRARADVALQRPRTEAEYQEILSGIARESERLGSLVENMLLLARADTGQWPMRSEKVFLDDILLDAASAARSLGSEKGVNVDVAELDETSVKGDPQLLRQLFIILLDNAVQYTADGGCVTASAIRNGKSCKVTIRDTGAGIPAAALPHVFDRFFRADSARGRGGAGLGLAIARWIVDLHGGEISLDSREGEGTEVRLSFPAV